jgi:hypothetical protein
MRRRSSHRKAINRRRESKSSYVVPMTHSLPRLAYGVGGGTITAAVRSSTSDRSCSQTLGALSLINSGATQRLVVATWVC